MISKLSEIFNFLEEIGSAKNVTLEEEIKIVELYIQLNEILYEK